MKYADHDDFKPITLGEVQTIYRWISTHAHCFIIEVVGRPIGECWLQRMNLRRIVDQFPGKDVRRIDLMIGEKELWGRGYGAEAIAVLVDFGFSHEAADAIFGIVSADNARSLRAFEKCGFNRHAAVQDDDGDPELRSGSDAGLADQDWTESGTFAPRTPFWKRKCRRWTHSFRREGRSKWI